MENKLYLWISLIVGVPVFRVIEALSVARTMSAGAQVDYAKHAVLGLVVGVGCALAAKLLKMEGRRLMMLPVFALGYAMLLLGVAYPKNVLSMSSSFVSMLLMLDMVAWILAVGGATLIGCLAMRPQERRAVAGAAIPRLDRA